MPGDSVLFSVSEEGTTGANDSILIADRQGKGPGFGQWTCDSLEDPDCSGDTKATSVWGATVFGPCETDSSVNCIENFEIALPGEQLQSGLFLERPDGLKFPAAPALGYPGGGTTTLWSAPHAPSESGTTDYSVNVRVGGGIDLKSRSPKWGFSGLSVNVIPYRLDRGERYRVPDQSTLLREDGTSFYGIGPHSLECAWTDLGRCGRQQNFIEGTKVKVTVRVSKDLGGWFKGRMKDPLIDISSFNRDFNRIAVEAQAVTIGKMAHFVERDKMTSKERQYLAGSSGGIKYGVGTWQSASSPDVFEFINYLKPKVGDKLAGLNVVWNFGTVSAGRGSTCLQDDSRVLGIVTTNALGFDGASPSYSRGSLNYNVGGLHLNPDGETPFMGTYDLVMRSDVARCLYGMNKAPVSATITVSGDGDSRVATQVVREKGGWLKLAAYGFTFSEKTIKVKLTQKKTTITCVAPGKKAKKVTAVSPKCPKGFKKR
jgi:hypothetical protein